MSLPKILAGCTALLCLPVTRATGQDAAASGIGAAIAANHKALEQYTHRRKVQILIKGEDKGTRVDEIRFDPSGTRQVTSIERPPEPAPAGGPLRAHIAQKKRAEVKAYVEQVMSLAMRYFAPDPAKVRESLAAARIDRRADETRLEMKNFVKSGDTYTLTIDGATHLPRSVEAATDLDGGPVTLSATFQKLPDGPVYPAQAGIKAPKKDLEIRISTYDYRR